MKWNRSYSFFLPAALTFAQRAFAAADNLARAAALTCFLAFFTGAGAFALPEAPAFRAAHRACWAAAILARVAALNLRLGRLVLVNEAEVGPAGTPRMAISFFSNASMRSRRLAA